MMQFPKPFQNRADNKHIIRRFPRRTAEDIVFYKKANQIAALEREASEWIKRGHEANVALGRVLIRLKKLLYESVGHGHFERYFERKFGKPYGIAFRTAQVYMQMARKLDRDAKSADPALFPISSLKTGSGQKTVTDHQGLLINP